MMQAVGIPIPLQERVRHSIDSATEDEDSEAMDEGVEEESGTDDECVMEDEVPAVPGGVFVAEHVMTCIFLPC